MVLPGAIVHTVHIASGSLAAEWLQLPYRSVWLERAPPGSQERGEVLCILVEVGQPLRLQVLL